MATDNSRRRPPPAFGHSLATGEKCQAVKKRPESLAGKEAI